MTPKFSLVTAVAGAALLILPSPPGARPAAGHVPRRRRACGRGEDRFAVHDSAQPSCRAPVRLGRERDRRGSRLCAQPFNLRHVLASDSVESARQQAQPFNLRHMLASDSVQSALGEG